MKRIITLLFATILLFTFVLPCYAEAVFETAYDLNQLWASSGTYPDYVCGVWTNDGSHSNLTIAVLNTEEGNKGKEEILQRIEDDSSVTFVYGEYSRNYLTDVQNELMELFKTSEEHGLVGSALLDKENRVDLLVLKEYEGNEATENLLSNLVNEYGDIFIISYGDAPEEELITAPVGEAVTLETKPNYLGTILLIILLLSCITFMVIRKRRAYVLKASTGETLNTTDPISDKQVEEIVKNSAVDYPNELDEKIKDTIDKID